MTKRYDITKPNRAKKHERMLKREVDGNENYYTKVRNLNTGYEHITTRMKAKAKQAGYRLDIYGNKIPYKHRYVIIDTA